MPRTRKASRCYRCGKAVKAGDGNFELVTHSHKKKWPKIRVGVCISQHADCAITYQGTPVHYKYKPAKEV